MTSWTLLIGVLAILLLSVLIGWMASDLLGLRRRVTAIEEALRLAPLTPTQLREPEPGSYILSDAEAAQVEAALLAESRGRALSRGARGWRGFSGS